MFKNIDLLPAGEQEYLFTHALFAARAEQDSPYRGLHFVFTSTVTQDSEDGVRYLHRLPILVELPPCISARRAMTPLSALFLRL